jgi:hypothetical protein
MSAEQAQKARAELSAWSLDRYLSAVNWELLGVCYIEKHWLMMYDERNR